MNSSLFKLSLPVVAALFATLAIVEFSTSADGAVVKRSVIPNDTASNTVDIPTTCRFNDVCGWEVYNPSTRAHMYYVTSSCRCTGKDSCIRVDDDINVPAYVYRCRDLRRRNKTRPSGDNDTTTAAPSS